MHTGIYTLPERILENRWTDSGYNDKINDIKLN